MRKLVKKLALVLALVLAIGCIAPASAQAEVAEKWTWNFDAEGLVKPTKNMLVDEKYQFQVLKYGEALNAEEYSVKYYAKVADENGKNVDTDAVLMGKNTGVLVALEAAKDIKIAAVVKNLATGGTAKVWAFVDVYAADELEIIATTDASLDEALEIGATFALDACVATVEGDVYDDAVTIEIGDTAVVSTEDNINFTAVGAGETEIVVSYGDLEAKTLKVVVLGAEEPEQPEQPEEKLAVVGIKQLSKKEIEITFNKAVTADVVKTVKSSGTKIDAPQYNLAVKSVAVAENVAKITLYSNTVAKSFVHVALDGLDTEVLQASDEVVASIDIVTANAAYETLTDIEFNLYDANGVFLGKVKADDLTKTTVELCDDYNGNVHILGLNQIYFNPEGSEADIKVVYDTGKLDASGLSIKAEDYTTIYALKTETIYGAAESFGITNKGDDKASFGSATISVGTNDSRLVGKATKTITGVNYETKTYYISGAVSPDGKTYIYQSSDPSKLLVTADGKLIPIAEGTVEVAVFKDTTENCVGTVVVTVKNASVLASLSGKISSGAVVSNNGEKVVIALTGKDQYTGNYDVTGAVVTQPTVLDGTDTLTKAHYKAEKNKVTIDATGLKPGSYIVEVSVGTLKTTKLSFTVKEPSTTVAYYTFNQSATTVDSKLAKDKAVATVTLSADAYDANGVWIKTATIAGVKPETASSATDGKLYYELKVPTGTQATDYILDASTGKLVFKPYKVGFSTTSAVQFAPNGNYTFTLYQGKNGVLIPVKVLTVTVTNTQPALAVTVDNVASTMTYAAATSGSGIGIGSFTVTGGALVDALTKANGDDKVECLSLKGSADIWTSDVTEVKGYSDGSRIVVTEITVNEVIATKENDVVTDYTVSLKKSLNQEITFAK